MSSTSCGIAAGDDTRLTEAISMWWESCGNSVVNGTRPTEATIYQCCWNTVYAHLTEAISMWWESCGNSAVSGTRPTEAISMWWEQCSEWYSPDGGYNLSMLEHCICPPNGGYINVVGKLCEQCSDWYSPDGGYINVMGRFLLSLAVHELFQTTKLDVFKHCSASLIDIAAFSS